jgi:hemolysin activation/secretion protein
LLVFSTNLHAQRAPDAGAMEQQLQQGRQPDLPRLLSPPAAAPSVSSAPVSQGPSITVQRFEVAGSSVLSPEQVKAATAAFVNRPIGMAGLQGAADALAAAFRDAGFLVRTYVPEQDFVEGKVTIQVEPAVLGKLDYQVQSLKRLPLQIVEDVLGAAVQPGQPIRLDRLNRGLLLADDLVGVTVSGLLRQGDKPGQTDVVLSVADEPAIFGEAALDNWGSRSTGVARLSTNVSGNSLLGLGDLTTVNAIATEGSTYLRLGGTLPVGSHGFRVGFNLSDMRYRVLTAEFRAFRGDSKVYGVDASYPLVRSRQLNLYAKAAADFKTVNNYNGSLLNSANTNKVASLGLSGNLFDAWFGGGASSASINYYRGSIALNSAAAQSGASAAQRSAGTYDKWRYSLSRQQELRPDLTLFLSGSGQLASRNLDSSEKFYLGGPTGVRAYPNSEGGGDQGQMGSVELRWRAWPGWVLTGFVDAGQVTINRDNHFAGASTLNSYRLAGKGLGLSWQASRDLVVKSSGSQRIGSNPNPTATGNDQDGTLVKTRWWLAATLSF